MNRRLDANYVNVQFAWTEGSFHAAIATSFTGAEAASQPPLVPQSPGNKLGSFGHFLGEIPGERWGRSSLAAFNRLV